MEELNIKNVKCKICLFEHHGIQMSFVNMQREINYVLTRTIVRQGSEGNYRHL